MAVVRCRAPWDRYQVNGQRQWVLFDVAGRQCLCFYRCAWLGLPLATGATVCVYSTVYGRCVLYIMSVCSSHLVHVCTSLAHLAQRGRRVGPSGADAFAAGNI